MANKSNFRIENAIVNILRDNEKNTVQIWINNILTEIELKFEDKTFKKDNFYQFNQMAQEQSYLGVEFSPEN